MIQLGFHGKRTIVGLALGAVAWGSQAHAQWPQWGGPKRDFQTSSKGIAESWPEAGPKRIWERALGEGYSSIIADGTRLFTMYRNGDDEIIVALKADTGATEWEHKYNAPAFEKMETRFGKGPNSTPTIEGDLIYTLGVAGTLHCLNKNTGKPVWSHDLIKEYKAKPPEFGFSTSGLAYKGSFILPVGGEGYGVAAFSLADGKLLWHKHDFINVYSSPIVIQVDNEDQIALLVADKVVGIDPKTGDQLWSEPLENQFKTNISTPVWGPDRVLYVSTGIAGSRGLKFSKSGGKTVVEQVWKNDKMQVSQGNALRVGDFFYGSSAGMGPAFVSAVHAKTGELAFQERGFAKANMLYADGKFLILDEEGVLAIGTVGDKAFKVHSRVSLLKPKAWTIPTLVDNRLYLRDQKNIMALSLGIAN